MHECPLSLAGVSGSNSTSSNSFHSSNSSRPRKISPAVSNAFPIRTYYLFFDLWSWAGGPREDRWVKQALHMPRGISLRARMPSLLGRWFQTSSYCFLASVAPGEFWLPNSARRAPQHNARESCETAQAATASTAATAAESGKSAPTFLMPSKIRTYYLFSFFWSGARGTTPGPRKHRCLGSGANSRKPMRNNAHW